MNININQDLLMSGNSHQMVKVIMCPVFGLALLLVDVIHWGQNLAFASSEPQEVAAVSEEADEKCQSPINISPGNITVIKGSVGLNWTNYEVLPESWNLTNNGQSVVLTGNWASDKRPYLQGGVLPRNTCYNFNNVSFRWGPSDTEGSEHMFNSTRFAFELQMVHLKNGTDTLHDACRTCSKDSILIIAYLFEVIPVDNPLLDPITNYLPKVIAPGSSISIPPFPLSWFYEPFEQCYYTYKGSLTQPPCSEIVTWIILNDTLPISARQVNLFRMLHGPTGPILNSSRVVQHRHKRQVYFYT